MLADILSQINGRKHATTQVAPNLAYSDPEMAEIADGAYRLVFAGSFVQLNHPGVTVDATLQFSYRAPTPSYLYTTCATREWLSNYASGRRYRVVTVQDSSPLYGTVV